MKTSLPVKPLAIRIENIQTHLHLADTKAKYSFPDSDVEKTFRDMGYGGNPKLIEGEMPNFSKTGKKLSSASHSLRVFNKMKAHSPTFHGRFVALFSTMMPNPVQRGDMPAQPSGHDPTPSTSIKYSVSNSSSIDLTPSPSQDFSLPNLLRNKGPHNRHWSQHLADQSKGKRHMTDAPSKRDVSLGTGDSPNHIGKKLPSNPTKSQKRKRSDTSISSSQDEDIPPKPTSKGDDLTEESKSSVWKLPSDSEHELFEGQRPKVEDDDVEETSLATTSKLESSKKSLQLEPAKTREL
ncbi:hypothetical protein L1987_43217 [Smallanthus sonchifolius]|uniref:Uncharacterized protein n=1 Tax=Smallanthus sonchifolius TaxID=185202 RepID=A0ACB9GKU0_9ASTR|nr:hypothetical protein L1987_43217 [Smallanthus sonchifolius]